MEYVEWLASAEYYVGVSMSDDAERTRLLECSVKHYKIALGNTKDKRLYNKALSGIVLSLNMLGKNREAGEYAMKMENERERNEMLVWCLTGKERTEHAQRVAEGLLGRFLLYIRYTGNTKQRCDVTERILSILFPDKNYQYYHNVLQYNAMDKAMALCEEGQYDDVIAELEKARFHAKEMVKYDRETRYGFTAPLFNTISGEKKETDSDVSDLDAFIACLNNNSCFDPIREKEEFKALLK